ncbi:MAG TPA: hypothetical protein VFH70_00765 [Acidimicrobiales bacterium]|nr:hypothetical protein [Acidimicrobiales bacterium]
MDGTPAAVDRPPGRGVNHYTLVFSDPGARAIAEAMSNQATDPSERALPLS